MLTVLQQDKQGISIGKVALGLARPKFKHLFPTGGIHIDRASMVNSGGGYHNCAMARSPKLPREIPLIAIHENGRIQPSQLKEQSPLNEIAATAWHQNL